MTETDFDVGIIGGGPAGAGVAAYLAKAGVKCVVFERALFPRPHVGESLVPSAMRVFNDLDFLPTMEAAKFPRKYGAVWTSSNAKGYETIEFDEVPPENVVDIRFDERPQPGVDRSYTYHVDRGKFDLLLLQHAESLGATVYEGVRITEVDVASTPRRLRFKMGANTHDVTVKLIIDASGRHTVLGNQLKLKVKDPVFDQYATHTWFEGFDRAAAAPAAISEHIFVHFVPKSNTWMWQIPITDAITSFGVVTQRKNFAKDKEGREKFFWEIVANRPDIEGLLRKATQIRPMSEEGDYSYSMTQICGDGFVLIGDAARFVDPIFSTGVSIALNSARLVHHDVLAALAKGDVRKQSFASFENTIRIGTQTWYDFISVYYRLNILFTRFVMDRRYRLDILKLLQGDVYDDAAPPVLKKMRDAVIAIENDPKHAWHNSLSDLTASTFRPLF